ncbi:hypothetical protein [Sphingomicrobium arenosum]|uniref:hypothetical protein n=1 Tax=Sphingomicrobium arenosum TaxID=2233861 RepID=UPI002240EA24|nr:hypothetical protein [Sphingomicrobium arenosum]
MLAALISLVPVALLAVLIWQGVSGLRELRADLASQSIRLAQQRFVTGLELERGQSLANEKLFINAAAGAEALVVAIEQRLAGKNVEYALQEGRESDDGTLVLPIVLQGDAAAISEAIGALEDNAPVLRFRHWSISAQEEAGKVTFRGELVGVAGR